MLDGMARDAQIELADQILSTIVFVPMLFLPEVDVSISILSNALKELCEVECAQAIKLVPSDIKGNVLDPTAGVVSTIVSTMRGTTQERVEEAMAITDMVLASQDDLQDTITAKLPSMTNQEIMYWIAKFNTSNLDPANNCSVKGASAYMEHAVYWYKRINKMGFDHVGTRGRLWISVYNGWCWKGFGKGSWYVENMVSSGAGTPGFPFHCELPDESTWERIPQEFMMTAIASTPDAWTQNPLGFGDCEHPHPLCHTHFNQYPETA